MKKLAVIGECMIELNGEPFGLMKQAYGGDTLNTATYISRVSSSQCIEVYFVSSLGKDKLSQSMLEHWKADGINTNLVLRDDNHHAGLYLIQLDSQGERTFLYWRNQSAARYLLQHQDFQRVLSELKKVDMIYLSGISLAILPKGDRQLLITQLQKLKQNGVKIAFDSNFRHQLWEDISQAQNCYMTLLPLVDIALVTADDEKLLWGDQDAQSTIQRLSNIGIPIIIVKQGKEGAICVQYGKQSDVPTAEIKNVVDTTSAGDAFNAGFLAGYLQNKPLLTCCQQGNQLAGVVIQHQGAIIDKSATAHFAEIFK